MAKNREVNFFAKISSDEDFEKFIEQKGLLILDVFLESFGPCALSLHATLEKAKLSLADNNKILLAVCNADKIEKLRRFRKSCKPTILFCSRGKAVAIMYGANTPILRNVIAEQLKFEEAEALGAYPRAGFEFNEFLPSERFEHESKMAVALAASQILKAKQDLELHAKLDEVIELMQGNSTDMGVTLFMPHVIDFVLKKTADIVRRLNMTARARKMIEITHEMLEVLNYQLENPIDDDVMDYLQGKGLLCVLWTVDPSAKAEEVLATFMRKATEPQLVPVESENGELILVEQTALEPLIVYLDGDDKSTAEPSEDIFDLMSKTSDAKSTTSEDGAGGEVDEQLEIEAYQEEKLEEAQRPMLIIPPAWTPINQAGNAVFKYTFFRHLFDSFLGAEDDVEPPHLCMIFPASAYAEILEVSEKFPKELLSYGFFNGSSVRDCEFVCKTVAKYEELPKKPAKIFLKVAKRTSHFVLTLACMNPQYVSHSPEKGAAECAAIFNDEFRAHVDEVQKKKK